MTYLTVAKNGATIFDCEASIKSVLRSASGLDLVHSSRHDHESGSTVTYSCSNINLLRRRRVKAENAEARARIRKIITYADKSDEPLTSITSRACESHEHINLNLMDKPTDPVYIDRVLVNDSCPLCRLIRCLLLDRVGDSLLLSGSWVSYQLFPFSEEYQTDHHRSDEPTVRPPCQAKFMSLIPGAASRDFRNDFRPNQSISIRRFAALESEMRSCDIRKLRELADMERARSWLRKCEQQHPQCGEIVRHTGAPVATDNMYLVDIVRREIVQAAERTKYVALSYVWGGDHYQTFKLLKEKTVPPACGRFAVQLPPKGHLPATIEDAMVVAGDLGFDHIWVDVLCVLQDDPSHLAAQISLMHKIYAGASLTIVAADGENAQSGLIGAPRRPRRIWQHVETIDRSSWAGALPSCQVAVSTTLWNTRAWTFQEQLLSPRCLFFTSHQTYFECQGGSWREDMCLESVVPNPEEHLPNIHGHLSVIQADATMPDQVFRYYSKIVNQFSKKVTTRPDDLLNAFEGIAQVLGQKLETPFVFGLPMEQLAISLLWMPESSPQQRPHKRSTNRLRPARVMTHSSFPTWSWAGCCGEVSYDAQDFVPSEFRCLLSWREATAPGRVTAYTIGHSIRDSLHSCPSAVQDISDSGVLHFDSWLATFRLKWALDDDHNRMKANAEGHFGEHDSVQYVLITDKSGTEAGEMRIDTRSSYNFCGTEKDTEHQFILVGQSRRAERHFWNGGYGSSTAETILVRGIPGHAIFQPPEALPPEVEPWSYFRVLLVKRSGDTYHRVAAGVVHQDAWSTSKPVPVSISLS